MTKQILERFTFGFTFIMIGMFIAYAALYKTAIANRTLRVIATNEIEISGYGRALEIITPSGYECIIYNAYDTNGGGGLSCDFDTYNK